MDEVRQSTIEEFYRREGGEFRCDLCEFTTPHYNKARRHAYAKHGVEIPLVVVVRPHWDAPVEENVQILVEPVVEESAVAVDAVATKKKSGGKE